jgi:hypothetical protein
LLRSPLPFGAGFLFSVDWFATRYQKSVGVDTLNVKEYISDTRDQVQLEAG